MLGDFQVFMPIAKVEKKDDGTRIVSGYASTPSKDLDGEIISLEAISNALPAYMEWRNIRQMHQPIAVGVAKEANVDEAGLYLTAKIVDEKCVRLLDEQVLKGFSIGGRKVTKKGDTITELELIEISVVDRPANPDCKIEIIKGAKPVKDAGVELVKAPKPLTFGLASEGDDAEITIRPSVLSKLLGVLGFAKADSEAKPYGDVAYADPGYQSDGKKRYPIDSEEHIRAAWSYISKPKNAAKYTSEQCAKIKGKIEAAWKEKIDAEGPPSAAAKYADGGAVIKGLDSIGRLCYLIQELEWLRNDAIWEREWEKDDSPQPEMFANAIGVLIGGLKQAVEEETNELIEGRRGAAADDEIEIIEDAAAISPARADAIIKLAPLLADMVAKLSGPTADQSGGIDNPDTADADSVFAALREEIEMNQNEFEKRFGAGTSAAMSKAKGHLGKAAVCHKAGMGCMTKAANAVMAAKKLGKALELADLLKAEGIASHLTKAAAHFEEADDHRETATMHLGKAMGDNKEPNRLGGEGAESDEPGGEAGELSQTQMTEGEVPEYVPDEAYPGKFLRVFRRKAAPAAGSFTEDQVKAMVEAAVKTAKLETENAYLRRQPAGASKARIFAVEKSAPLAGADPGSDPGAAVLFNGVGEISDQQSATAAATTALTNMFSNQAMFGKSMGDPSFRGMPRSKAS